MIKIGYSKKVEIFLLATCIPLAGCQTMAVDKEATGIFVATPKVYDDRALQQQLNALRARLSQLTGLDQASLTARIGSLQGASAEQRSIGAQATGLPVPGTVIAANANTPSVSQIVGGTGPTSGQTTTSQPSNLTTTTTTSAAINAAAPAAPATPSSALPTAYSVSSSDTLNEQLQLSYEIINLQLLLQGSLDDEFSTVDGRARKHATIGFPISVSTPSDKAYENAAAEVEIRVCPPAQVEESSSPTLMTILPREKSYNTATLSSKSVGLGAGAVVVGLVNLGVSFLWGHQTYFIVQAQDTVAFQREPKAACGTASDQNGKIEQPVLPVVFAWQFRPVLGQSTIRQGLRQTFAQISFPPGAPENSTVTVVTSWRKYDKETGVAGELISASPPKSVALKTNFNTTFIKGIEQRDNGDGSLTAYVYGHFLAGTRVRIGDAYFDESIAGFVNNGESLRFSAPLQLVAAKEIRLVSSDGKEEVLTIPEADQKPIQLVTAKNTADSNSPSILASIRGSFNTDARLKLGGRHVSVGRSAFGLTAYDFALEGPPNPRVVLPFEIESPDGSICQVNSGTDLALTGQASWQTYSDSLVEVNLPLLQCTSVRPPNGSYPMVVILGGKAFGLSDAPFNPGPADRISFLAPKSLIQGQRSLVLKRLFLGKSYQTNYTIKPANSFSITGITVLSQSKTETAFAITGSKLSIAKLKFPSGVNATVAKGDSYMELTLPAAMVAELKQLVFQVEEDSPIFVAIPPAKADDSASKVTLKAAVGVPIGNTTPFIIEGTNLKQVLSIRYLDVPLPFSRSEKGDLITLQLPSALVATKGIKAMDVTLADGTTKQYDVTIVAKSGG